MLTLKQFKNPKGEECGWRLSKRRVRDQDGALAPLNWISRCVDCSDKHQILTVKHNEIKTQNRRRIRQDELMYFRSGKTVQVHRTPCTLTVIIFIYFNVIFNHSPETHHIYR